MRPVAAIRLIPSKRLSCMCSFAGLCGFKSGVCRGRSCQQTFNKWQVAIDKTEAKTLQYQELSLPMAPVRTTHRKETPNDIEYGEATLTMLNRQPEVIAPVREGYRLSVLNA